MYSNWGTESDPEFKGYHNGNSETRAFGMCDISFKLIWQLPRFNMYYKALPVLDYFDFMVNFCLLVCEFGSVIDCCRFILLCFAVVAAAVGTYLHVLLNVGGFLTTLACVRSSVWLPSTPPLEEVCVILSFCCLFFFFFFWSVKEKCLFF